LSDNTDFDVQQDDANFIDDGIEIEPFNLDQEREEGYFDDNGNFVEFARGNDMKVLRVLCLLSWMFCVEIQSINLLTQVPICCRMPGWTMSKLTQSMLKSPKRKRTKKRSSRTSLPMILER
jgi:hypothetical protein